jgi:hypothetical protein
MQISNHHLFEIKGQYAMDAQELNSYTILTSYMNSIREINWVSYAISILHIELDVNYTIHFNTYRKRQNNTPLGL